MTQREDEERGTSRSGLKSRNVETDKGTKVLPKASESLPLKGPTGRYTAQYESNEQRIFLLSATLNIYSCTVTYVTCL